VIGAVLVPGAKAPKLVTRNMISKMAPGSVVVDIAVDQGGCIETCKPTTHENPTFVVDGVIHYCVANMPGAVARTSTYALTNVTLKYARMIAKLGIEEAAKMDPALKLGINIYRGDLVYEQVARDLELPYKPLTL
jgi:alanine dehydrogenase